MDKIDSAVQIVVSPCSGIMTLKMTFFFNYGKTLKVPSGVFDH